jgi:hypothetical protein
MTAFAFPGSSVQQKCEGLDRRSAALQNWLVLLVFPGMLYAGVVADHKLARQAFGRRGI